LDAVYQLTGAKLHWEAAYGKAYQIQVSMDGHSWQTLYSTDSGNGGLDTINLNGVGRYVRMNGLKRGTNWGYSLWEFEIFGAAFTPDIVTLATGKPATAS